jgi:hypothetical protein
VEPATDHSDLVVIFTKPLKAESLSASRGQSLADT